MNLFEYTYCGNYNRQIQNLARIVPEKWSFGGNDDNGILKGYLEHTFQRVYEEKNYWRQRNTQFLIQDFLICIISGLRIFIPNLGAGQAEMVSRRLLHRISFIKIRNCQSSETCGICNGSG